MDNMELWVILGISRHFEVVGIIRIHLMPDAHKNYRLIPIFEQSYMNLEVIDKL